MLACVRGHANENVCVCFVQNRYTEIIADPSYIDSILADGGAKANEIAQLTLSNTFQAMGFSSRQTIG